MFGAVRSEPVTDDELAQAALVRADVAGWDELRDAEAAELRHLDLPPPWCPGCGAHLLDRERPPGEPARCPVCLDDAVRRSPAGRALRANVYAVNRAAAALRRSGWHLRWRSPSELLTAPVDWDAVRAAMLEAGAEAGAEAREFAAEVYPAPPPAGPEPPKPLDPPGLAPAP